MFLKRQSKKLLNVKEYLCQFRSILVKELFNLVKRDPVSPECTGPIKLMQMSHSPVGTGTFSVPHDQGRRKIIITIRG